MTSHNPLNLRRWLRQFYFALILSGRTSQYLVHRSSLLCTVALLSLSLITANTSSATFTWNGGGSPSVNWSVGSNWGGTAPTSNTATDLIFAGSTNLGTIGTPLNQNIANPMLLNSITFNSTAGSFFLGGNAIRTDGNVTITQSSSNAQNIANVFNVDVNSTQTLTLDGSGTGLVTLSGAIDRSNGNRDIAVVKNGTSTFLLSSSASDYTGGTTINGGTLKITNAGALGNASPGAVAVNAGTLEIGNVSLSLPNLTLNNGSTLLGSGGTSSAYSKSNFPSVAGAAAVALSTASSGDVLSINSAIRDGNSSSNITVNGPGAVAITSGATAATAYAGSWHLNGSSTTVLRLSDANALGNPNGGSNQRPITLTNGTLQLRVTTGSTFSTATTIVGSVGITPDAGAASSPSNTHTLGTLAVSDGLGAVNTLTLTVNHGSNYSANNTGSVTFGATTLSDSLTLQLNNTNGSGIGTTTLGALNDGSVAKTITKNGAGTLTLGAAATSLVNGTAVNITGGTLNSNNGTALGSLAAVGVSSGATFSVGASQTIGKLTGAGSVSLGGNTLTVGNTSNLSGTFSGGISGSGGSLTKAGTGTLTLSGTNTYTGATAINAGELEVSGSLAAGSTVNVATGGTLSGNGTINGNVTLTGNGVIDLSNPASIGGTLAVTGGNWNGHGSVTGLVTSSSGTFTIGAGGHLTADGGVNVTGGTFVFAAPSSKIKGNVTYTSASSSTLSGVVEGAGKTVSLNNAAAILTLTAANTYTGATTVNAGTLSLDSGGSLTSDVTVLAGTLTGSGSTTGAITIGNGAGGNDSFISPGNSPGTIVTSSALSLLLDSTYNFELDSGLLTADQIVANGASINGATFSITDLGAATLAAGTSFTAINNTSGSAITGTLFSNLPQGGMITAGANTFEADYFAGDGNDLVLTVVPELDPTSLTLIGAIAIQFVWRSRGRTS